MVWSLSSLIPGLSRAPANEAYGKDTVVETVLWSAVPSSVNAAVAVSGYAPGTAPAGTDTFQVVVAETPPGRVGKVDGVVASTVQPSGAASVTATSDSGAEPDPFGSEVVAVSTSPGPAIAGTVRFSGRLIASAKMCMASPATGPWLTSGSVTYLTALVWSSGIAAKYMLTRWLTRPPLLLM